MFLLLLFYAVVALSGLVVALLLLIQVAHVFARSLNALMGEVAALRLYLPHKPKTPAQPVLPMSPMSLVPSYPQPKTPSSSSYDAW